jgi:hypothetical protein
MCVQAADTLVRVHQLPAPLGDRIREYYAFVAELGVIDREAAVVAGLSPGLRQDMLLHMYRDLLLRVPFFANKSSLFILEVVQVLETEMFPPGEVVVHQGEVCMRMFFIDRGIFDVVIAHNADDFNNAVMRKRLAGLTMSPLQTGLSLQSLTSGLPFFQVLPHALPLEACYAVLWSLL